MATDFPAEIERLRHTYASIAAVSDPQVLRARIAELSDATKIVDELEPVDLAYLDPPYNQHRYFTNYHVWETLVRWDAPEHYGVACKRVDARDQATKSVFNRRREMPRALAGLIARVRAEVLVLSFSDEGFVPLEDLVAMCGQRGRSVEVLAFDSARYNGARIGVFNASGQKVGRISHTRNTEYVLLAGEPERIARMSERARRAGTRSTA